MCLIFVHSGAALDLMNALGKTVQEKYPEAFLVIGFAETATAISSAVAYYVYNRLCSTAYCL